MTCPHCQARNPDGAAWCSQCLAPLGQAPTPPPTPEPARPVAERPQDAPTSALEATPGSAPAPRVTAGDDALVRTRDGAVEWRCRRCESWTSIDLTRCAVCNAEFGEDPTTTAEVRPVSPTTALAASILVPGAGHVMLGRIGTGIARGVIAWTWLLGGLALTTSAMSSDQTPISGVLLLLGAVGVWGASLVDLQTALAGRRDELLEPKVLVWVVAGVVGLLTITLMFQSFQLAN